MELYKALKKLGFEFDDEFASSEERLEVWVNRKRGMGVAIEWFRLPKVTQ